MTEGANISETRETSSISFSGTRTLAAIVFTDTVGFTALVGKNEEHTLAMVERDLTRMRVRCESFGGFTVKTTGDGLLLFFNSAVQAVSCALAIQKEIYDQNQKLAPLDCLQHRIGVHLGDVFVNDQDVMGDGVNVAARLQAESIPGGVCISSTLFDVINNRIQFQIIEVCQRNLKNIGLTKAYQIAPIGLKLKVSSKNPAPTGLIPLPPAGKTGIGFSLPPTASMGAPSLSSTLLAAPAPVPTSVPADLKPRAAAPELASAPVATSKLTSGAAPFPELLQVKPKTSSNDVLIIVCVVVGLFFLVAIGVIIGTVYFSDQFADALKEYTGF